MGEMIVLGTQEAYPESTTSEGRELLRDAIEMARISGLWQELRMKDKKSLVDYFYARFLAETRRTNAYR